MIGDAIRALREGRDDITAFVHLCKAWGNPAMLTPVGLMLAFKMALRSKDPILETGSGLSTIVLGLAAEQIGQSVTSLEHDAAHAKVTQQALDDANIHTVGLYHCPVLGGDGSPGLPDHIGFWLHDGPMDFDGRSKAFDLFAERAKHGRVLVDDFGTYPETVEAKLIATHRLTIVPEIFGLAVCVPRVQQPKG
jgi:hypothetical protein